MKMKTLLLLAILGCATAFVAAENPGDVSTKKEIKNLQGAWTVHSLRSGITIVEDPNGDVVLEFVFRDTKLISKRNGKEDADGAQTYRVNPKKLPSEIDI